MKARDPVKMMKMAINQEVANKDGNFIRKGNQNPPIKCIILKNINGFTSKWCESIVIFEKGDN